MRWLDEKADYDGRLLLLLEERGEVMLDKIFQEQIVNMWQRIFLVAFLFFKSCCSWCSRLFHSDKLMTRYITRNSMFHVSRYGVICWITNSRSSWYVCVCAYICKLLCVGVSLMGLHTWQSGRQASGQPADVDFQRIKSIFRDCVGVAVCLRVCHNYLIGKS